MSLTYADAHGDLIESLDAELPGARSAPRGSTRSATRPVVRRIAEGVVRAHDERSLTGASRRCRTPTRWSSELVARVSGFGAAAAASSTTRRSRRSGSTTRAGCSSPATAGTS